MFVRQWTIVGMPRVFSNVAPGEPANCAPPTTVPFWTNTVVPGYPAGSICTVASESEIVYSLRMTCPEAFLIAVGAHTGKIGSCVLNIGIVVGSMGVSLGGGRPIAEVIFVVGSFCGSPEMQPAVKASAATDDRNTMRLLLVIGPPRRTNCSRTALSGSLLR